MLGFYRFLSCLLLLVLPRISHAFPRSCPKPNNAISVPPTFYLGPVETQYTSCSEGFDGPKISAVNESVYDWWYFDAVSDDGKESIVVIFFTSSLLGFPLELPSAVTATSVIVFATFADGSNSENFVLADNAQITTSGNGASGAWGGAGASFVGAPDLSTYKVTMDNALEDIQGTFTLESAGPGHFPCSPLVEGANELLIPNIGWVNVMPAATGTVNFTIGGKNLQFTGAAYHDKNWGDIPFIESVNSWYWGHGTLGPYYIVWFDAIASDDNESASGYVVKDGRVVGSTCDTLEVRPVGTTYPPTLLGPDPTQYTITMTLDDGTKLAATITVEITQFSLDLYSRWTGTMEGTIGSERYRGSALWEQFKIAV